MAPSLPISPSKELQNFLSLKTPADVATFFGFRTYRDLAKLVYWMGEAYRYQEFTIPKKNGGKRKIHVPCRRLKALQRQLKDVLYEVYSPKRSAHGFCIGRSIVTNASVHLGKRWVFNVDLEDYFETIHFGRLRNLFMAPPLDFPKAVATVLAQSCCVEKRLPQGAPTSPVLANMVTYKMDSELQVLAKASNCTYTRYADDITFSFTCSKQRLPSTIVGFRAGMVSVGSKLRGILVSNGFKINEQKVRLAGRSERMEVTGLTVNERVNVKRRYIRKLSAMLHAWDAYGLDSAEEEFHGKYLGHHGASGAPIPFLESVLGRFRFLKSVRGSEDRLYNRMAKQFNALLDKERRDGRTVHYNNLRVVDVEEPIDRASKALWVIMREVSEEQPADMYRQGTAFESDYGLITCEHVVTYKDRIQDGLTVHRVESPNDKRMVSVLDDDVDKDRDLARISLDRDANPPLPIPFAEIDPVRGQSVHILGFPVYDTRRAVSILPAIVTMCFVRHGVRRFEVSARLREGNSGGPVINSNGEVVGVVANRSYSGVGGDSAIAISSVAEFLASLTS